MTGCRSLSASMKLVAPFICLAGVALAGCGYLPTSGPTTGEVVDQGIQDNQTRYDVVDVNSMVVATLASQPAESFRTRFGKYGKPPAPKIGIGDTVSVSIWEAAGGGLFGVSPTDHVSAGSRNVTIPEQVVARDGAISVPFAGRVPVAGRSTVEVQHDDRAASRREGDRAAGHRHDRQERHQCRDGVRRGRQRRPGAALGQRRSPARSDRPRRGGEARRFTTPLYGCPATASPRRSRWNRLVSDPAENIYAQPGDVLTLVQVPQTFSVLGATGQNAQLNFSGEHMTLVEALAKAGGLQDLRSDPAGVFLFRFEPPNVVAALNAAPLGHRAGSYLTRRLSPRHERRQRLFSCPAFSGRRQGHNLRRQRASSTSCKSSSRC